MAGRNYGLRGPRYVITILIPASLPAILSGLKIGWAFARRTLIAAELVFGASSGEGGLGWYIFQNRNELFTDRVFAGLLTVIAIGLLVEGIVFASLEKITIKRWGCSVNPTFIQAATAPPLKRPLAPFRLARRVAEVAATRLILTTI